MTIFKTFASVALAVLLSATVSLGQCTTCGTSETFDVSLSATGKTSIGSTGDMISVKATLNNVQTASPSVSYLQTATAAPVKVPLIPGQLYEGVIELTGSDTSTGCYYNVTANMAVEGACGWTLQSRIKPSDNSTDGWQDGGAISMERGIRVHEFQCRLVKKVENETPPPPSPQSAPATSEDAQPSAAPSAPSGSVTPPTIPAEHRGLAPAAPGAPPAHITPISFNFSVDLGSNVGSQGYNIGTVSLQGPLSESLVDADKLKFANPGMPGVEIGTETLMGGSPPEEVEYTRQVHLYTPAVTRRMEPVENTDDDGLGLTEDPTVTVGEEEALAMENQALAKGPSGQLIVLRSNTPNPGIKVLFYETTDSLNPQFLGIPIDRWNPGSPNYTTLHELGPGAVAFKTVEFIPIPPAGDHGGGIRVNVRAPGEVTRSTEYVTLLVENSWRVSTLSDNDVLESTDHTSFFVYDEVGGNWTRNDLEQVTRDGQLYSKSSRTYLYRQSGSGSGYQTGVLQTQEVVHDSATTAITTSWVPDPVFMDKARSMSRSDGSWEAYNYYTGSESAATAPWKGKLKQVLRPWKNGPADPSAATANNSESTILTYETMNLQGINPSLRVKSRTTTHPLGTDPKVTRSWALNDSEYALTNILNHLGTAGLDAKWMPSGASIRSEGSTENKDGDWVRTSSYIYRWGPDSVSPWIGSTLANLDDEGNGFATGYERGTYVPTGSTYTFTPNDPKLVFAPNNMWGNDVRSVTVNLIGGSAPANQEATREVIIRNSKGVAYLRELSIRNGSNWVVVSTTVYESHAFWSDGSVKGVLVRQDGRLVAQRSFSASGYDTLESDVDEQGIETRTLRDALGRVKSVTRLGTGSQPTVVTNYTPAGRMTTAITSADGAASRTTIIKEDLMGRIREENVSGVITKTDYPNGGRDTRTQFLDVTTRYVARGIDGRTTSVIGTSVVPAYYTYEVTGSGNMVTKKSLGTSESPRYTVTEQDLAGRTVRVSTPSPTGVGEVQSSIIYHPGTSRAVWRSTPSGDQVFDKRYSNSMTSLSGVDLGNGLSEEGEVEGDADIGVDRLTETGSYYSFEGGAGWQVSYRKVYDVSGDKNSAITTISKRCLSGNSGGYAYKSIDISPTGETVTTLTSFDTDHKMRTTVRSSSVTTAEEIVTDVYGLTVSRQDRNGNTPTRWEYNAFGQPVKEISPRGAITRKTYNPDGSLHSDLDHAGKETTYEYYPSTHASAGRLSTITNPLEKTTTYVYSALGKVTEVAGSAAYKVAYRYDAYGAMDQMTTWRETGTPALTTWIYQPGTGLISDKLDANSQPTSYTYDDSGKVKTRTWARGVTTTYTYSPVGDLTGITYSGEPAATAEIPKTPAVKLEDLDLLGRPTTIKSDDVIVEKLTYHPGKGTLSSRYNATTHPLLPNRGISYDAPDSAGRSVGFKETSNSSSSTPTPERTVAYAYDPASGNLQTITDGTQSHVYSYHPNSSLVEKIESRTGGTAWFRENRYYDTPARLIGIRSDRMNGSTLTSQISTYAYDYDDLGRRKKSTFLEGSTVDYTYNDRSEVTAAVRTSATGASVPQLGASYTYDGIGNRKTSTSPVLGDHTYTPDSLNRYTSITTGNSRYAVGRALVGWTVQVAGNNANRIGEIYHWKLTATNTSVPVWQSVVTNRSSGTPTFTNYFWYAKTPTVPTYDLDGNLTNDGRWAYTWDAENRLIQMKTTTAATTAGHPYTRLKFAYDWQGRRIARTVWKTSSTTPVSVRRWLYDGWNVIAEFSSAAETGTTVTRLNTFTWGTDLSGTLQGAGGVGGLLGQTPAAPGSVMKRASYDGNGNIVSWTESNATAPISRREYDAFGNTLVSEGAWPSDYGFSTKPQDVQTGLYYYGYRFYNAEHGRWLNRDPIEETGGNNLYGFIWNSTTNFVDVLGLREQTVDKCVIYLAYDHGSTDEEDKKTVSWKFPGKCALGGFIGCFPESNLPQPVNTMSSVPKHDDHMDLMDANNPWRAVEDANSANGGENPSPEFEHGMPLALDKATSDDALEKDVGKLCECECKNVRYVIDVGTDPNLFKGINRYSKRWKNRLKQGKNSFDFDCSSPNAPSLDP